MQSNTLGVDALVKIGVNAVQVTKDVKTQLADGFQILVDIPVIVFKDFSKIQEVAQTYKQAWEEIKDLKPGELTEFQDRVAAETGLPADGVVGKVRQGLRIVDRTYAWVNEGIGIFEDARLVLTD